MPWFSTPATRRKHWKRKENGRESNEETLDQESIDDIGCEAALYKKETEAREPALGQAVVSAVTIVFRGYPPVLTVPNAFFPLITLISSRLTAREPFSACRGGLAGSNDAPRTLFPLGSLR